MGLVKLLCIFVGLLELQLVVPISGQTASIELMEKVGQLPGQGVLIQWNKEGMEEYFKNYQQICVNGLWALYNQPNYGQANIDATTVWPVRGIGRSDCGPTGTILSQIKSMKPLGVNSLANPHPYDIGIPQIEFYTQKYFTFRTAATDVFMNDPNPPVVGTGIASDNICEPVGTTPCSNARSIAVSGDEGYWLVCDRATPGEPTTHCVCLDVSIQRFKIPDLDAFPSGNPLRVIQYVAFVTDAVCDVYDRPGSP